jgi:putative ABC transport system permease protein
LREIKKMTLLAFIVGVVVVALVALLPFLVLLFGGEWLCKLLGGSRLSRFLLIMFKSLRRNLLRTSLTYLATFVLVMVVTLVWSVLYYLDALVAEKAKDLKVIVTERWQAFSEMPWSYASELSRGAADANNSSDVVPEDSMTWQYYIGTMDPTKDAPENSVFLIAMEPAKVLTILDRVFREISPDQGKGKIKPAWSQVDEFRRAVHALEENRRGVLLGQSRLKMINKRVGERFTLTGSNFKGIDLEFEILGVFPPGPFDQNAVMRRDYLNDALDVYPRTHAGAKHPLADRSLHAVWLQVPDQQAFSQVTGQIERSTAFRNPAVRCQTLSAAIATSLDSFRDMIWAMRWLLTPAILITMALVISNAISLGVRERRMEIAVLKVLGFRPWQVLGLVLGEGVVVGALSGFISVCITYLAVDQALDRWGSAPVYVPVIALLWGPILGAICALAGSLPPAASATTVKVANVFSRIA